MGCCASNEPRASEVRKFTFTSNGKRYGICLGALGDRIHDPYRCNGGGVEGEYGQANQLVVCSPEKATTLFWSQQYPHVNKLLINDQRRRCINVHWWKLVEGTACSIYDAYPQAQRRGRSGSSTQTARSPSTRSATSCSAWRITTRDGTLSSS